MQVSIFDQLREQLKSIATCLVDLVLKLPDSITELFQPLSQLFDLFRHLGDPSPLTFKFRFKNRDELIGEEQISRFQAKFQLAQRRNVLLALLAD